MDNFEWAEGFDARFGLVEVDFTNQKRKIRKSGNFFSDLCKNHGVTSEMIKKYLSKI
jgi:beta-glucosidase